MSEQQLQRELQLPRIPRRRNPPKRVIGIQPIRTRPEAVIGRGVIGMIQRVERLARNYSLYPSVMRNVLNSDAFTMIAAGCRTVPIDRCALPHVSSGG